MGACFFVLGRGEGAWRDLENSFYRYLTFIFTMKKKRIVQQVVISIGMEVKTFVKVKAYKRFRFGKVEKVKGYYREY